MSIFETNQRLQLRERAQELTNQFAGWLTQDVMAQVINTEFAGRIGLVSSFGTEAAALLHMVARIESELPVVFLDTWKHFPETLDYRDDLVARLGLRNVQVVTPRPERLQAEDPDGQLHTSKPDLCCHVRKTLPMLHALQPFDGWITGRKRHQSATRADISLFEVQDRWIKINPLFDWGPNDLNDYFAAHDLPEHPLKRYGYLSVGCAPCTRAVKAGEDSRAGRWASTDKTECGIHFENGRILRGGSNRRS